MDNISVETIIEYISLYGVRVIGAIAIFFIGKYILKHCIQFIKKIMETAKVDKILISFGCNILYALGLTFITIAALGQLGVQTTSLAAIIAAAGLAIGLALQSSLSNLAAGVMLIIFRPFKVGDYISAGGTSGSVKGLNIFTTTLTSPDNKTIIIPNAKITEDIITNYSAQKQRRLDMVFGIGYGDDIKTAKELLTRILEEDERVLKDPEPTIGVLELADSSVNFAVRPWVKTSDYWDVFFDLNEKVKLELDNAGISIPFPQRDIHIYNEK